MKPTREHEGKGPRLAPARQEAASRRSAALGLDSGLYRKEAIERYLDDEDGQAGVAAIAPPWTWVALAVTGALVLAAVVAAFVVEVEVTARAPVIVRPPGGTRVLTAQIGGTVTEVMARSGQPLDEGSPVLRLDSVQLRADLLEAERHLQLLDGERQAYAREQAGRFDEQEHHSSARLRTLTEQLDSQAQSVHLFERKLAVGLELARSGLISDLGVEDAKEALAQARRQLQGVRLQLDQAAEELSLLQSRRGDAAWESKKDLRLARSRRDALAYSLEQTVVRVPRGGVVDAVLVSPGDAVAAGQVVGKLIPADAELSVTGFLPERHRAFTRAGDVVRIELEQLPYLEFGTVEGRIARIGDDLAAPDEVKATLGEDVRMEGPSYRLDVDLPTPSLERFGRPLRTGMLGSLRYTVRRQRLVTVVLEPLRRWLD